MSQDATYALALRMPIAELGRFCQTDKRASKICADPHFWKLRALRDYGVELKKPGTLDDRWYRRRYMLIRAVMSTPRISGILIGDQQLSEEQRENLARMLFSDSQSAVPSLPILFGMISIASENRDLRLALRLLERYAEQLDRLPAKLRERYELRSVIGKFRSEPTWDLLRRRLREEIGKIRAAEGDDPGLDKISAVLG